MATWRLLDYVTEENRNLTQEWYATQATEIRAEFDVTVAILEQTDDWTDPLIDQSKVLTGRHVGLSEVKFYIDEPRPRAHPMRRRFRTPGLYRPVEREFIFILGCEKRGLNTLPAGAFDDALRYKAEFEQGRGRLNDHI